MKDHGQQLAQLSRQLQNMESLLRSHEDIATCQANSSGEHVWVHSLANIWLGEVVTLSPYHMHKSNMQRSNFMDDDRM